MLDFCFDNFASMTCQHDMNGHAWDYGAQLAAHMLDLLLPININRRGRNGIIQMFIFICHAVNEKSP